LQFATQRSAIWRKRIDANKISRVNLADLPILTRADVIKQVEAEGPLLSPSDRIRTIKHSTSGSSGTPVQFFVTEMNKEFGEVRFAAQYFLEGFDLASNSTQRRPEPMPQNGFTVEKKIHHLRASVHLFVAVTTS
jgi:phenylacetate-coenzyme A ligase PaaK-like adenylate-forming protein